MVTENRSIKIAPSLLSADFGHLADQIASITESGADYLHIDVMDGHFVPNLTIGLPIVKSLQSLTNIPLDVHLMIKNPSNYIKEFIDAGANIVTVHIETDPHIHRLIERIKSLGAKAGIALNPSTSLNLLDEIVSLVDLILIMSVNPGFGGQKFIPQSIKKISRLKTMLEEYPEVELEVDGGITEENINDVINAGADIVVVGSAVFNNSDISGSVKKLKSIANQRINLT